MKRPVSQQIGGGGVFGQGVGLYHGVAHMEEAEGGAQREEVGVGSGWLCSRFSAMTWWWPPIGGRGTGEPDDPL